MRPIITPIAASGTNQKSPWPLVAPIKPCDDVFLAHHTTPLDSIQTHTDALYIPLRHTDMGRWSMKKKQQPSPDDATLKGNPEMAEGAAPPGTEPAPLYEGPRVAEGSLDKTQKRQQEVDEVKGIMEQNVNTMLERGENLQDLTTQTETLQNSSQQFSKNAAAVKKKLWWKNVKMGIIVAAILLVIVIAIVAWAVISNKKKGNKED
jgi:vesicle-associated membrane protein 4